MEQHKRLWELDEVELASGSLITARCEDCQGTGQVSKNFFGKLEQFNCRCVWLAESLLKSANFPARFQGKSLADLDWAAIQPPDLVGGLRDYAEAIEQYGEAGIGMVLYGNVGNGKTHVAIGIGKIACGLGYTVAFASLADFLDGLREEYDHAGARSRHSRSETRGSDKEQQDDWQSLANSDWLILDDLGTENLTLWVKEKVYQLVNRRWLQRLPTIVTTNRSLQELAERFGEGVLSRLWGDGLAFHFQGEDYRFSSKLARLIRVRQEVPTGGV